MLVLEVEDRILFYDRDINFNHFIIFSIILTSLYVICLECDVFRTGTVRYWSGTTRYYSGNSIYISGTDYDSLVPDSILPVLVNISTW